MRSAPAALKTWLAGNNVTWRADLITLTLLSGTQYFWTTADATLIVGGTTFAAGGNGNAPVITRGPYRQSGQLQVDTLDITLGGPYTIGGKALGLLAATGFFYGATVQVDHLISAYPGDVGTGSGSAGGPIPKWFYGPVSLAEPQGADVVLRCKSPLEGLTTRLPKFIVQPQCNNAVYDTNCALTRASYTSSGVVAASSPTPTTTSFGTSTGSISAQATGYYNLGVVTFTSGVNNGLKRAIASQVVAGGSYTNGLITLALALPAAPAAGDTLTIYPGCDRAYLTCLNKFANTSHYRGFPNVPNPEGGS